MKKYSKKVQRENRKLWLEALRSGKYKKSSGFLKTSKGYCCLGVLTDAMDQKYPKLKLKEQYMRPYASMNCPEEVMSMVGLSNGLGHFSRADDPKLPKNFVKKNIKHHASLSDINDIIDGVGFKTIADIIEAEPKGLFVD